MIGNDEPQQVPHIDLGSAPLSTLSDHALVVRVARRDPAALAEIYDRHGARLEGLVRHRCGEEEAKEIVRGVFVELWSDPGDSAGVPLRTYLLRAAHERSMQVARPAMAVEDPAAPSSNLLGLSSPEREAIELARFGGASYREIAEVLRRPEEDIRRRLRTGLRQLRALVDGALTQAPVARSTLAMPHTDPDAV